MVSSTDYTKLDLYRDPPMRETSSRSLAHSQTPARNAHSTVHHTGLSILGVDSGHSTTGTTPSPPIKIYRTRSGESVDYVKCAKEAILPKLKYRPIRLRQLGNRILVEHVLPRLMLVFDFFIFIFFEALASGRLKSTSHAGMC